jgi:hypothetical protein
MAQSLPLAHAMPSAAFVTLTEDPKKVGWKLFSPAKLAELGIKPLRPDSAEVALGTAEFVFVYCGQFRYPETQVGFVFGTRLERDRNPDCLASPFDTGALHRKVTWPAPSEPATSFLARHTLPVPRYREYLANRIQFLFAKPTDYVALSGQPLRPDPIGLQPKPPATGNDPRLWTFEIRVRNEVELSPPCLEAVFYQGRHAGARSVRDFFAARTGSVQLEEVFPEDDGDFAALQRGCLDFLRKKGIIPTSGV